MAKVTQETKILEVDADTGEVKRSSETTVLNYGTEPAYIKMYLKAVTYFKDLPRGYAGILGALLSQMTYASLDGKPEDDTSNSIPPSEDASQVIILNKWLRKNIAANLGIAEQTLNNAISRFCDAHILKRLAYGTYQVNPHFFGRGQWKDIKELRMHITFDGTGTTFWTEVTKHQDEVKEAKANEDGLTDKMAAAVQDAAEKARTAAQQAEALFNKASALEAKINADPNPTKANIQELKKIQKDVKTAREKAQEYALEATEIAQKMDALRQTSEPAV